MLTFEYIKACMRGEVANPDPTFTAEDYRAVNFLTFACIKASILGEVANPDLTLLDEAYRARYYPLADVDSEFTLADVITEAQNRGFTMDDLEEMSIQLGY